MRLAEDDPLAVAICAAIRNGDTAALKRLLAEPDLVSARIVSRGGCNDERSPLHVATDWPGHYPNSAATVAALVDAVAFGQWSAARRLIDRGAQATLWQAAALGLLDRVERAFSVTRPPSADEITNAFWCACHGGQRTTAEYLLARGADRDWIGHDQLTPGDAARRSDAHELVTWLEEVGAHPATRLGPEPGGEHTP